MLKILHHHLYRNSLAYNVHTLVWKIPISSCLGRLSRELQMIQSVKYEEPPRSLLTPCIRATCKTAGDVTTQGDIASLRVEQTVTAVSKRALEIPSHWIYQTHVTTKQHCHVLVQCQHNQGDQTSDLREKNATIAWVSVSTRVFTPVAFPFKASWLSRRAPKFATLAIRHTRVCCNACIVTVTHDESAEHHRW